MTVRALATATSGASRSASGNRALKIRGTLVVFILLLGALVMGVGSATAAQPTITVVPASGVGFTSVKAAGQITPGGSDTSFHFEYLTDQQFAENESNGLPGFEGASQSGFGFVEGSAGVTDTETILEGLTAGAEYHLRLIASNGDGEASAVAPNFTTQTATPPSVTINPPSAVSYTKAHLSGTIDPEGGNVNPLDGPVSIGWEFQVSTTAGSGFSGVGSGSISGAEAESSTPIGVEASPTTLSDATEYHYRLVAFYAGHQVVSGEGTFETLDATPPTVTLQPVTDATGESVVAHALINPNGAETIAWFEYSLDGTEWRPAPYFNQGELIPGPIACQSFLPPTGRPCPPKLEGNSPLPFEATINEHDFNLAFPKIVPLEPNTEYQLRVKAENPGGPTVSPPASFKTSPVPPVAQTLGVRPESDSATVSGRINPRNSSVTYQFDWGPLSGDDDESYENVSPAAPQPTGTSGSAFKAVSAQLAGLQPNTRYHYRVIAINTETGAEAIGAGRVFVTAQPSTQGCPNGASRVGPSANLPDCRVFEWVTPGMNSVAAQPSEWKYAKALPDGSALVFRTEDAVRDAEGAMPFAPSISRRTPNGWELRSLSPPSPEPYNSVTAAFTFRYFSRDFSEWIVVSSLPLGGETQKNEANLYLHRSDGSYLPLTIKGYPFEPTAGEYNTQLDEARASADFSHIFFPAVVKQLPDDPLEGFNWYEWSDGELRLLGYLPPSGPGEEELPAPYGVSVGEELPLPKVSADGKRVLFQARDSFSSFEPGLFLRTDGQETVDVAASQRSPEISSPRAVVEPIGISADGSRVLFISPDELTDDANTGEGNGVAVGAYRGADLYAYDVASGVLTDLTATTDPVNAELGARVKSVVGTTADASYVYFTAQGALAPGAASGEENLYVWHDGETKFVAAANVQQTTYGPPLYVTPDGRNAVFVSSAQLTSFDNEGHSEVYQYSYGGSIACVSCRSDGQQPTGDAFFGSKPLSDDGTRVFFNSSDQVVPGATNGRVHAYEYSDGDPHLLTPGDGGTSLAIAASDNANDVFIAAFEELVPGAPGHSFSIYDARVDAEVPQPPPPTCKGEACRGPDSATPSAPDSGSARVDDLGRVAGPKSKQGRSRVLKLRLTVPSAGHLTVHGKYLKKAARRVKSPGSVDLTVALKRAPEKKRQSGRTLSTKAYIAFTPDSGAASTTQVALKFLGAHKKGGK